MGSKYFALNCLNILRSLLPDRSECDTSQKMFAQEKCEDSNREQKYKRSRGNGRPINHTGSQLGGDKRWCGLRIAVGHHQGQRIFIPGNDE